MAIVYVILAWKRFGNLIYTQFQQCRNAALLCEQVKPNLSSVILHPCTLSPVPQLHTHIQTAVITY